MKERDKLSKPTNVPPSWGAASVLYQFSAWSSPTGNEDKYEGDKSKTPKEVL